MSRITIHSCQLYIDINTKLMDYYTNYGYRTYPYACDHSIRNDQSSESEDAMILRVVKKKNPELYAGPKSLIHEYFKLVGISIHGRY